MNISRRSLAVLFVSAIAVGLGLPQGASSDSPCVPRFHRIADPGIPFFDENGPVLAPWLGGWEKPRPQLKDADLDGDLDAFFCEEDGQLRYYRNDGTAAVANFVFQTDMYGGVHELYFARLADLDADGDLDLLVEAPPVVAQVDGVPQFRTGAFLYWNDGSADVPRFVNRSTHSGGYFVDVAGEPITFFNASPDFVDLEGDGDLDLLMGDGGQNGFLVLYRNLGTPFEPLFFLETRHYRNIAIVFGACDPTVTPPPQLRHGYMLFEFADIDADSDPDLFVGDQFNANAYFLSNQNSGGETSPFFACQSENYLPGPGGGPGVFSSYLLPALGDLDGDGDADVLAGSGITSETGVLSFTNQGVPESAFLVLQSTDAFPEFDFGRASAPLLVDFNGDGPLDLLLGAGSTQRAALITNGGSAAQPSFFVEDPLVVEVSSASWVAPEMADIDADGDADLFVGTSNGAVRFWRNDAGAGQVPILSEVTTDPAFGPSPGKLLRDEVDEWAVPRFFDEDEDGDLDLLVGNWDFSDRARLLYFRNDGTAQSSNFVLSSSDYQDLGVLGQNLAPVFGDFDGDADLDLIVGNYEGRLHYVRNVGRPGAPRFRVESTFCGEFDAGISSVPTAGDLDDDGDLDLLVGESGGGLNYLRNDSEPGQFNGVVCDVPDGFQRRNFIHPLDEILPTQFGIARVFPNPSRSTTQIDTALPAAGRLSVAIYNAQGQLVRRLLDEVVGAGNRGVLWAGDDESGRSVAPGVYQARVVFGGQTLSRALTRIR